MCTIWTLPIPTEHSWNNQHSLSADILKDPILDNKIKDDGLFLRESIFGWVVSGPVVEEAKDLPVG